MPRVGRIGHLVETAYGRSLVRAVLDGPVLMADELDPRHLECLARIGSAARAQGEREERKQEAQDNQAQRSPGRVQLPTTYAMKLVGL